MFELYVVETVAVSTPGIALACRVRGGTVNVGDRVTRVTTPKDTSGQSTWRCDTWTRTPVTPGRTTWRTTTMNTRQAVPVAAMETDSGGLVTLFGLHDPVKPDRTLTG